MSLRYCGHEVMTNLIFKKTVATFALLIFFFFYSTNFWESNLFFGSLIIKKCYNKILFNNQIGVTFIFDT